ncbi:aldose 1-epimerase family protein [Prauserella salsuginis]|uniref:aldose 1-epimerase family protein n=1 Tax=Prauserella salsuginis TaxID=387889 RepID=UPI0021645BB1|nr:aldose 1-epimerase family protein [Prauserella salsuginis]MCR3721995.1 Galactose mutarotase [Prauserella flava]MCR3736001.1 Galactose mutarotase [Prauserella salsuginis]
MNDTMTVAGDGTLTATVADLGAQLISLTTPGGQELLWQAGRTWPWHAPVLFPVIGRSEGDRIRHRGQHYIMPQHGIARRQRFRRVGTGHVLVDDAATRRAFPFRFRLTVDHWVADHELVARYRVDNPGDEPLPFALGVHPAFRWPLPATTTRRAHTVVFDRPEPQPIRRVTDVLLRPQRYPSPVRGRVLPLDPPLFDDGAAIFDRLASRSVTLGAAGSPSLTLTLREGFDHLAIWSPPTGQLLCLEPWTGLPCRQGDVGEFRHRPGLRLLPPGASETFTYGIRVTDTN